MSTLGNIAMHAGAEPKPSRAARRARTNSRRSRRMAFAALLVLMAAVVTAVLLTRGEETRLQVSNVSPSSENEVSSPYDLRELPMGIELDVLRDSNFISLLLNNGDNGVTSYSLASSLPAAKALTEAVVKAKRLKQEEAAAIIGSRAADSTMTFVLPGRETVTFALYLKEGVFGRGSDTWRPKADDLAHLIESAIARPD